MLSVNLVHEHDGILSESGNPINDGTPDQALLLQASGKKPLRAADGHQLTLGEFDAVRGSITAKRIDDGTAVTVDLSGLIPNGAYALSLVLLGGGPEPVGMGAASDDPKDSIFVADEDGEALFSAVKRAGKLSGKGEVTSSWLTGTIPEVMGAPMVMVVGSYLPNGPSGQPIPQFSSRFLRLMLLNNEIRDAAAHEIADRMPLNTPIFEFRKQNQITAPPEQPGGPRRPVTLGEFRRAYGEISAKCIKQGTEVAMRLHGLIPHGVYTIWLAKPDPADPSKNLGFGALGSEDGSGGNSFVADRDGEAYLVGSNKGGKLSGFGTIAQCWLTGEPVVQVAGVYHIDDQTHGATAGPDGTYAVQFAWVFAVPPPPKPGV